VQARGSCGSAPSSCYTRSGASHTNFLVQWPLAEGLSEAAAPSRQQPRERRTGRSAARRRSCRPAPAAARSRTAAPAPWCPAPAPARQSPPPPPAEQGGSHQVRVRVRAGRHPRTHPSTTCSTCASGAALQLLTGAHAREARARGGRAALARGSAAVQRAASQSWPLQSALMQRQRAAAMP